MCARRNDDSATPLCRFAFKNGRRCSMPAHPDYDGLCYAHGTFEARASRHDNLLRELAPLASGSSSLKARRHGAQAVSRAVSAGRLSPESVPVLVRLGELIEQTGRFADEQAFASQSGTTWDRLRQLVDDLDTELHKDR
jgi:hypothetical protein